MHGSTAGISNYDSDFAGSGCSGYCRKCGDVHSLPEGPAREYCFELARILENEGRIDFHNPRRMSDPRLSVDYLFGDAGGQMFGVLVCEDLSGERVVLRAFSGQYNGVWMVGGWTPPLLDVLEFYETNRVRESIIKSLGREMDSLQKGSAERKKLVARRKALSRGLMKDIHGLYRLNNFRGETGLLKDVFLNMGGIPAGTGDCCAPKLLNYAALKGLRPVGIAEFYYGRQNRSGGRKHMGFYTACKEKCAPIIGYMLCGAEQETRNNRKPD